MSCCSRMCSNDSELSSSDGELMLFGVKIKLNSNIVHNFLSESNSDQPPKSLLLDHHHHHHNRNSTAASGGGYVSLSASSSYDPYPNPQKRKQGVAWTEEEHKLFLKGLKELGRGKWNAISTNFVKTRSTAQVASHAQKHFLHPDKKTNRRRKSSLFDITTTSITHLEDNIKQGQETNTTESRTLTENSSSDHHQYYDYSAAASPTLALALAPKINNNKYAFHRRTMPNNLDRDENNIPAVELSLGLELCNYHHQPNYSTISTSSTAEEDDEPIIPCTLALFA